MAQWQDHATWDKLFWPTLYTGLRCHNLILTDQLVGLFAVLSAGLLNSALDLVVVWSCGYPSSPRGPRGLLDWSSPWPCPGSCSGWLRDRRSPTIKGEANFSCDSAAVNLVNFEKAVAIPEHELEVGRFRFLKNHDSDSFAIFGTF